jgi:hypothetical protein
MGIEPNPEVPQVTPVRFFLRCHVIRISIRDYSLGAGPGLVVLPLFVEVADFAELEGVILFLKSPM